MLLVPAFPDDQTADRFAAHAWQRGVAVAVVRDWRDLDVSIRAERDGRVTMDLRFIPDGSPVTAILNRGAPLVWGTQPDAQFLASEVMATWWTAFGLFPGPVVNRPSPAGFVPNLDRVSLDAAVLGLALSPGLIGTDPSAWPTDEPLDVYRLRDGAPLGHRTAADACDAAEVCAYIPRSRGRVRPILVAGDAVFDLMQPSGCIAAELLSRLEPLVDELHRRQATFSLMGIEVADDAIRLAYANAFPAYSHYQHLETAVHDALLAYLT